MKLDVLIKNGRVIDTSQGLDQVSDIGVLNGRIVDLSTGSYDSAERVIDARNHLVLPGLIDYHTHVFHGGTAISVEPNSALLPCGVTATVDAGSAGWANYPSFSNTIVSNSLVKIKSYLHVVNVGLATLGGGETGYLENINPANFNKEKIKQVFTANRHELLGLKLRFGQELYKNQDFGVRPLLDTIVLAEQLGCPVCIHATNSVVPAAELADKLRPGDVYAHCYHGKQNGIIGSDGKVLSAIKRARERGVIFDCSNGVAHFDFDVTQRALAEGFTPDVISTDLTTKNCYSPTMVFGLPFVMSKYLAMGLDLTTIVKAVTETPAKLMGLAGEIGTLRPGAVADIAVFQLAEKEITYADTAGRTQNGSLVFKNQLTIADGTVVFRQIDF